MAFFSTDLSSLQNAAIDCYLLLTAVFIYVIINVLKLLLKINENSCINIWYSEIKYVHLIQI